MIFCPDRIIPDSGLTGPNNIYLYKGDTRVVMVTTTWNVCGETS